MEAEGGAAVDVEGMFNAIWSVLAQEGWSTSTLKGVTLYLAPDASAKNFMINVNVFEDMTLALAHALELASASTTQHAHAISDALWDQLAAAKLVASVKVTNEMTVFRVTNLATTAPSLIPNVTMFDTKRGAISKCLGGLLPSLVEPSPPPQPRAVTNAHPTLPSVSDVNSASSPQPSTAISSSVVQVDSSAAKHSSGSVQDDPTATATSSNARHEDVLLVQQDARTSGIARSEATTPSVANQCTVAGVPLVLQPIQARKGRGRPRKKPRHTLSALALGEIEDGLLSLGWKVFNGDMGRVYCKPDNRRSTNDVDTADYLVGEHALVAYIQDTPSVSDAIQQAIASSSKDVEPETEPAVGRQATTCPPNTPDSTRAIPQSTSELGRRLAPDEPPAPPSSALEPPSTTPESTSGSPPARAAPRATLRAATVRFADVFKELAKRGWTRRPNKLGYTYCMPGVDQFTGVANENMFFSIADVEAHLVATQEWACIEAALLKKPAKHQTVQDSHDLWKQLKACGWTRKRVDGGAYEYHAPGEHPDNTPAQSALATDHDPPPLAPPKAPRSRKRGRPSLSHDRSSPSTDESNPALPLPPSKHSKTAQIAPDTISTSPVEATGQAMSPPVRLLHSVHEERPGPNTAENTRDTLGCSQMYDTTGRTFISDIHPTPAIAPSELQPKSHDQRSLAGATEHQPLPATLPSENLTPGNPERNPKDGSFSPLTPPSPGKLNDVANGYIASPLPPSHHVDGFFEDASIVTTTSDKFTLPRCDGSGMAALGSLSDNRTTLTVAASVGSTVKSSSIVAEKPSPSTSSMATRRAAALKALSPAHSLESLTHRNAQWQAAMTFVNGCVPSAAVRGFGSACVLGPRGTGKSALVALMEKVLVAQWANCTRALRVVRLDAEAAFSAGRNVLTDIAAAISNQQPRDEAGAIDALDLAFVDRTHQRPVTLLVLDKVDALVNECHALDRFIELAHRPHSSLILIGIANSIERTTVYLQSKQWKSVSIECRPYYKAGLRAILNHRLAPVRSVSLPLVDAPAIEYVAEQVAAVCGDAHMAMDICILAILVQENHDKNAPVSLAAMTLAASVCLKNFRDQLMHALPQTTQMVLLMLMKKVDRSGRGGSRSAFAAYLTQHPHDAVTWAEWTAHMDVLDVNGIINADGDTYKLRVTLENMAELDNSMETRS